MFSFKWMNLKMLDNHSHRDRYLNIQIRIRCSRELNLTEDAGCPQVKADLPSVQVKNTERRDPTDAAEL